MHDIWLGMTAAIAGKVVFLCLPLISYRRHGQNASTAFGTSQNSVLKKLLLRLELAWMLVARGLNSGRELGPKIDVSIITVCFNSKATLVDTVKSVLSQEGVDIEYLIIDGGSRTAPWSILGDFGPQDLIFFGKRTLEFMMP